MILKNKLKSLFNLSSIKEDVQKEKYVKLFDKVKLFTVSKEKLFLSIILFTIIINGLIAADYNDYHIRAIFSFVFLMIIPGLLMVLCFKIHKLNFWEYLVYIIGLSISFIILAGLIINWILPAINITSKPLATFSILLCFNIFLTILGIIAWIRNKNLKPFDIMVPKLDLTNRLFFTIALFFPILSIIGTLFLNNHGANTLTMIMIGCIATYILLVTIFRKHLNKNIYPWALYLMGLSLLLMFSLRSWYFMGSDIVSEYHFFDLAAKNALWSIENYSQGHNICLSINILPTIINVFMDINPLIIFKIINQLIFSFLLIVIYLFFKYFSSSFFSFLAGFFFMSQAGYMMIMSSHIRQEISFLAMGFIFLTLFNKKFIPKYKKLLVIIFSIILIVSHYSTGYLTIILFIVLFMSVFFISIIYKKNKLFTKKIKKISFTLVLLLFILGFLWYSQTTLASDNLIDFVHKSSSNLNNLFKEDMHLEGKSFLDQFKVKPVIKDKNSIIQQGILSLQNHTDPADTYPSSKYENLFMRFIPSEYIKYKFSTTFTNYFYIFTNMIKKLGYLFIFLGLIYSLFVSKIKNNPDKFLISLVGIIFFLFIVLITLIPFGSISYGILRLYQQGLILFSIFGIIGANLIFGKINKKYKYFFISLFLVIYFLSFTGFTNQVIGGNLAFPNLNNFGYHYDTQYISNTEIDSIKWLSKENILNEKLYANRIYKSSIMSFGILPNPDWNIFPQIVKRNSYIYTGNSEVFNGRGFSYIQGDSIGYSFPREFIEKNKNKIYANGGSEIFR